MRGSIALTIALCVPRLAGAQPRVVIGPIVHVSADLPAAPHVEVHAAIDPRDAQHVIAAALVGHPSGRIEAAAFSSFDGGVTWRRAPVPGCDVDPWTAFAGDGAALVSCLGHRDMPGVGTRAVQYVTRSDDGGRSVAPVVLVPWGAHRSVDRPVLLADPRGPRVYAVRGQTYDSPAGQRWYGPSIAVSTDGGRRFGDPVLIPVPNIDHQLHDAVVLSDGSIAVLLGDFQQGDRFVSRPRSWVVRSRDGGRSFTLPWLVAEATARRIAAGGGRLFVALTGRMRRAGRTFAFDPGFGEPRGAEDVWLLASRDDGEVWSDPVRINDASAGGEGNAVPVLATGAGGTVAAAWADRRHSRDACFDVYASISLDSGRTFLPNARVTPETSCPLVPGNVVGEERMGERWRSGGDYGAMVALPDGGFRIFWCDSRTGVYQLYTAVVRVER